ncbi:MAG TPA: L,D-transpeptidase family protein [Gemmatimonadaceae bacterium]|nr:L,D-transpeptidase family protein [Gemmatimonadaceae bacterium]
MHSLLRRVPSHVARALITSIVFTSLPVALHAQGARSAPSGPAVSALTTSGDSANGSTVGDAVRVNSPRDTALAGGDAHLVVADRVVIDKSDHLMTLYAGGQPVRRYRVALGFEPEGDKLQRGDGRTPEGVYRIDWANPDSRYHLSLHISYPDRADVKAARMRGVSPGGDIMIHGLPNGLGDIGAAHLQTDWTDGCIAVTNEEMDEIWRTVPVGTVVEIRP